MFYKLYIDSEIIDHPVTKLICSKLKMPFDLVNDRNIFLKKFNNYVNKISLGKKYLYLTINKGNFLKKCPGTCHYICCNYSILNIGSFCHMDCSYCILQSYFQSPIVQFFVNYDEALNELDNLFATNKIFRIGTGEFSDSLIWDKLVGISKILVKKFASQNKSILELKTKTTNIKILQKLNHNKKTIVSWSLNTSKVIKNEERGTAPLDARLKAASKCQLWGYPLSFHFDPIIVYEGCKKDYKKVIEKLFKSVSPQNIVWISIGTFRFIPSLKEIIQNRFPLSKIIYGEFVNGMDGKMRYFKPIRMDIYKYIIKTIREIAPDIFIYFCMEDEHIWKDSMGIKFTNSMNLGTLLDLEAKKKCFLEVN